MSLRERIEQEIRERGPILFSRYMEICLYDPAQGYYSRNAEQFGKAGDFYTASDVHAVFGRLLARQFDEMWRALDRPAQMEILELGPGRGLLARDVLEWSRQKFPDFFAAISYTLQETSPALRARLRQNLDEHLAAGRASVPEEQPTGDAVPGEQVREKQSAVLRSYPPATPLIIFANEFFDALPVDILSPQGMLHLTLEGGRLHETWLPPRPQELEFLDRYGVHAGPGERVEVSLAAQSWVKQIANAIRRGFLLAIDYGYTRSEQLAGRHRSTLMTYRRHSASVNPYQAPGEQDITAHVNFTALAAAAEQAGMRAENLRTQSQFLMGIGEKTQFAEAFEDCRLPHERAKVALQLKHLVTPAGMGESFHVLVASKDVDRGKVASLSGLRFGTRTEN